MRSKAIVDASVRIYIASAIGSLREKVQKIRITSPRCEMTVAREMTTQPTCLVAVTDTPDGRPLCR
jgi:hypothetical protein